MKEERIQEGFLIGESINVFWGELKALGFEPAPSNSRLSVKSFDTPHPLLWSIDRLTIVGNLAKWECVGKRAYRDKYDKLKHYYVYNEMYIIEKLSNLGLVKEVSDGYVIYSPDGEQVAYFEFSKFDVDKARIDFNPNKVQDAKEFLETVILYIFENYHFSRIDVACDIFNREDSRMRSYDVLQYSGKKVFYGADRAIETIYWGSRASQRQIRLYDKLRERRVKMKDRLVTQELKSWWRLELQLRGSKTEEYKDQVAKLVENFCSLEAINKTNIKPSDYAMLYTYMNNESFRTSLSRPTRYKYKKMMKEVTVQDELKIQLVESFKRDFNKILNEFYYWRNILK